MRLGIGSYTYPWAVGISGHPPPKPLSATDLLERADSLGVGVVQICDNLPLDCLPAPDIKALAHRARAAGILVEIGTRGIAPDHLRAYLKLAQRLGSPILRVVIDTAEHRPGPEEVAELLCEVMPDFETAGIPLAVENHDRFTTPILVGILEAVSSPALGICLDTANSLGALEGPECVVRALAPWTVNLHLKDFTIRRVPHQLGFVVEGCPAGQGALDIPAILRALRDAGRDPNAILELWPPPEAAIEDTIRKEVDWARDSVGYLRRLIPD